MCPQGSDWAGNGISAGPLPIRRGAIRELWTTGSGHDNGFPGRQNRQNYGKIKEQLFGN